MMEEKENLLEIELRIGKILRAGVFVSSVVIIIGLLMFVLTGHSGYPGNTYPRGFSEIIRGIVEFKPFAWLMAGLFLLILTPVLRVLASIFAFAKEGDKLYVFITLMVLAVLVLAIVLGHTAA
ncbi:DUF1634 domain-containing protein [Lactococcus garvieae]|uniref:DUF1634 domain-containing protein n=1 Tax=Lactococcus garvieae TaxID=1363 RepID=UPI0009BCCE0B|nr:DUF1634 domain-containing protein [Lactococcus garvieae]